MEHHPQSFKALFKGIPFQVGYFYNRKAKQQIQQIINEVKPDHIYCQLIRVAEYVKNNSTPKTIDYQDVFKRCRTAYCHFTILPKATVTNGI